MLILWLLFALATADFNEKQEDQIFDKIVDKAKSLMPGLKDILDEFKDAISSPDQAIAAIKKVSFGGSPEEVEQNECFKYTPLGNDRYLLCQDNNDKPLAIYDLGFPNPFSPKQIARMALGTVGLGDINLRSAFVVARKGFKKAQEVNKDAKEELFKMYGDFEKDSDKFEEDRGDSSDDLPEGWENKIPYVNEVTRKRAMQELAEEGTLNFKDMNIKELFDDGGQKFKEMLVTTRDKLKQVFKVDFGENFFDLLKMEKIEVQGKKGYKLACTALDMLSETNIRVAKVADFRRYDTIRADSLTWFLLKESIGLLVEQINKKVPPLGSILKHFVTSFFRYLWEQRKIHEYAFWEFLASRVENADDDPTKLILKFISSSQEQHLKAYLARRTEAWWKRLLPSMFRRDDGYWDDRLEYDSKFTKESTKYLESRGYDKGYSMNKHYNKWSKDGSEYWAMNNRGHYDYPIMETLKTFKPCFPIDYKFPYAVRARRFSAFLITKVMDFVPSEAKVAGFPYAQLITIVLETLFIVPEYQQIYAEARMAMQFVHEEYLARDLPASLRVNHEKEITILYEQRINPFMLTRSEELDLLAIRWAHWGDCKYAICPILQSGCVRETNINTLKKDGCCATVCTKKRNEETTDCQWGEWSEWSDCSSDCGTGLKFASREIVAQPEHGGYACKQDDASKEEMCFTKCPSPCQWGPWKEGPCSVSCGDGVRTLSRSIVLHEDEGGEPCLGESEKTEDCFVTACFEKGEIALHEVFNSHIGSFFDHLDQVHPALFHLSVLSENGTSYSIAVWNHHSGNPSIPFSVETAEFLDKFEEVLEHLIGAEDENVNVTLLSENEEDQDLSELLGSDVSRAYLIASGRGRNGTTPEERLKKRLHTELPEETDYDSSPYGVPRLNHITLRVDIDHSGESYLTTAQIAGIVVASVFALTLVISGIAIVCVKSASSEQVSEFDYYKS